MAQAVLWTPTTPQPIFSPCRRWRYTLTRDEWAGGTGRVLSISLNPSKADERVDDNTIRRDIGFAMAWGFKALDKGNIFAWRSTDPRVLRKVDDPIGPENDERLVEMARRADLVVVSWGNGGKLHGRGAAVLSLLRDIGVTPRCFRMTKRGQPEHPLYMPYSQKLIDVPT